MFISDDMQSELLCGVDHEVYRFSAAGRFRLLRIILSVFARSEHGQQPIRWPEAARLQCGRRHRVKRFKFLSRVSS
jgi:hypothetical protein